MLGALSLTAHAATATEEPTDWGSDPSTAKAEEYADEQPADEEEDSAQTSVRLSPREREVVLLYASGKSMHTVARELALSTNTTRQYVDRARQKYAANGRPARTRVELYQRAVEDQILPATEPASIMLDHLNPEMIEFVSRMEMAFIGTADAGGEWDSTFRAGPPGFLHVLDSERITYPEYRGNGMLASLDNISENPHVAVLMIDFVRDLIGLHINGRASIIDDGELRREHPNLPVADERGRTPERWVMVHVEEAYVHSRKHIPRLQPVPRERDWGTDDAPPKGGDYFNVRARQNEPITGPY